MLKNADMIYYGGDYNPDQWDEETIETDMRLFRKAGINMVTLPVFSWAKLEPEEGVYNFQWLDRLMDLFQQNGMKVCLATSTVSQPAWLSTRYPEVLPVDIAGRKRTHGMRAFFCVNSLKYRERAAAMAEEMAKRYGTHPALAVWHVANEYGTYCYCPTCQAKFRQWLKKRYKTLDNLNRLWNTAFWNRTVYSFEEIMLPTELNDDYRFNPAIQLDYLRFVTDSTIECYLNEHNILKSYTPDIPVLTNMSGFIKKLDQYEMVKHMDYAGWDNYPSPKDDKSFVAFKHDIMRGLKNGQSYLLMEQSPNQQNWQPYNKLKRPGEVRLLSYQALAHGSDSCLFFQLRQSIAGQEKMHGAVISHAGHEDTRIFKECARIGNEFHKLGDSFLGGRTPAKVGILFDWNNWWALELSSGPSKDMDYLKSVSKYYKAFYEQNIAVDIINPKEELNGYSLIVAPMLYMIKEGTAERIDDFVKMGGTFIATTMTGLVDENDRCVFGEYPGKLRDILGIWVEETDALYPEEKNTMQMIGELEGGKSSYECGFLCDILHLRQAEAIAVYENDFYQGSPCITRNTYGKGMAYYIGTEPEQQFLTDFISKICQKASLKALYPSDSNVEITNRINKDNNIVFVINHNEVEAKVDFGSDVLTNLLTDKRISGWTVVAANDVMVLKKD